jgi:coenzyme F420-0:L-glutamate ligase/coenzyme F420-1:gamma-L-glutamate ligase
MQPSSISIIGIERIPEIVEGDTLSSLISQALRESNIEIIAGDIFVVAQKIVSKAEGRIARLDSITPSPLALEWAGNYGKDARLVEVVLRESRRIVRMDRGVMICETRHGLVCANAGVDASNAAEGTVILLPEDPDASARRIREALAKEFKVPVAVIISDTFGRPWREGLVNVAIGVSGIQAIIDYRGETDSQGRPLQTTVIALADELASAAEIVMRKSANVPIAIIRGCDYKTDQGSGRDLIRMAELDMFR